MLAEAEAIATASAQDRAKPPHRREHGEEQSEGPVGGEIRVGAERVWKVNEAEAEEMGGSALWKIPREVCDRGARRGRTRKKVPPLLPVARVVMSEKA